jgi:flagellar FliL protein
MAKEKKAKDAHGAEEAAPVADGAAGEGEAVAKKGLPLKLIMIAAAGAVVVVGGGGTAAIMMMSKSGGAHAAKPAGKEKPKDDKKGGDAKKGDAAGGPQVRDGPNGVVFYTLPDLVVNMQTADGRPSFLKLKLTLELPDHDTADVLEPNMPRLQDMFQVFLRELRPEDLAGSQGGYQLRMEILRRVNLVIAPAKANAVLIEEMLVN